MIASGTQHLVERRDRHVRGTRHRFLQLATDLLGIGRGASASADEESATDAGLALVDWHVVLKPRVFAEAFAFDVLRYADDVRARHRVSPDLHALADRVLARPQFFRHGLARPSRAGRYACRRSERASAANAAPIVLK
jgi:hypothetical protein